MNEDTPVPLSIHVPEPDSCPLGEGQYIDDCRGKHFAYAAQSPEHARLIVRAVNCHDDLVAALERLCNAQGPDSDGWIQARAALTKVKAHE